MPIRLGVHISIAGGIEKSVSRAQELGATAMQIFTRNPRGWKSSPIPRRSALSFRKAVALAGIDPVVVHTPYLVNLASEDERLYQSSIATIALDVERAGQLGAQFVVTHLGSAKQAEGKRAINRVIKALNQVLCGDSPVRVLLENSAGSGSTVGTRFEELQEVIEGVERKERVGVCFDTCHGFAAGYDFRSPERTALLKKQMDQTFGLRRLTLLHLNDCAGPLGGNLDRHAHIGQGKIGEGGFRSLLRSPVFRRLAMILETPKKSPQDDPENLARVRNLLGGSASQGKDLPQSGKPKGNR